MARMKSKWRFAIGTTSKVPSAPGLHYLIADFDGERFPNSIELLIELDQANNIIIQATRHGWHLYTDRRMSFGQLCRTLSAIGADPEWIKIGRKRGYFFLADKSQINFPWPVCHMVIHYAKKEA